MPAHFFPNSHLNGGGDESLNLANESDISAQKRYKLQLQAEINKLKEKYSTQLP